MTEQLQFVIRALNARLSDPTPTSEQYGRVAARVQGSPTASRRKQRGLDTSLLPGRFLRHVGNVQVWPQERPQCPRPRPRPPRSCSRATWGVFSGSGVCVGTDECCSSDLLPSWPVHASHEVNTLAFFHMVRGEPFSSKFDRGLPHRGYTDGFTKLLAVAGDDSDLAPAAARGDIEQFLFHRVCRDDHGIYGLRWLRWA